MAGKARLEQWMGQLMEVELKDGRLVLGHLMCTDREPNIVLSQCIERWPDDAHTRYVGLVMIAPHNIASIAHVVRTPVELPRKEREEEKTTEV